MKTDGESGRSRGFAYVTFDAPARVRAACERLNGRELPEGSGVRCKVMPALDQEPRRTPERSGSNKRRSNGNGNGNGNGRGGSGSAAADVERLKRVRIGCGPDRARPIQIAPSPDRPAPIRVATDPDPLPLIKSTLGLKQRAFRYLWFVHHSARVEDKTAYAKLPLTTTLPLHCYHITTTLLQHYFYIAMK